MDARRRADGEEVAITDLWHVSETGSRVRLRRGVCGFFCLLAVAAAACTSGTPPPAEGPVVARIGVPEAEVSAPDMGLPQVASTLSAEGLTFRSNDGHARPRLAESWTVTPNGLTWRFKLRSAVTFHDGTPVTAEAVASILNAAIANRARLSLYPGLADVVSIEPEGNLDIVIKLKRRSTFLLEDLSYQITKRGPDKTLIGTGGFKTVSSTSGEIEMVRNDSYYQGRPHISRVIIRPYPTLRTAWASLMRNEIDVLYDVSRDAVEFVSSRDVALYSYRSTYMYLIAFNHNRPHLKETPVRQALNAAIDRKALIKSVLKEQGVPASGPLWTEHWAYDSTQRTLGFDPALAGAVLDAAGLKINDKAGARRTRFSFTCILPEKWLTWERIALDVQKQLYDIGVDMQLQPLPADEFNRRIQSGNFDAAMIDMLSGTPYSRPYAFWHYAENEPTLNVFGFNNPVVNRWFDAIRSAADDAEYRAAAGQLQRALLDDPPALFLAWSQRTRAVSRRFDVQAETGQDPFATFWRWVPDSKHLTSH
jgi:peptide/nickel transport system substrate-binding protein